MEVNEFYHDDVPAVCVTTQWSKRQRVADGAPDEALKAPRTRRRRLRVEGVVWGGDDLERPGNR